MDNRKLFVVFQRRSFQVFLSTFISIKLLIKFPISVRQSDSQWLMQYLDCELSWVSLIVICHNPAFVVCIQTGTLDPGLGSGPTKYFLSHFDKRFFNVEIFDGVGYYVVAQ